MLLQQGSLQESLHVGFRRLRATERLLLLVSQLFQAPQHCRGGVRQARSVCYCASVDVVILHGYGKWRVAVLVVQWDARVGG